MSTDIRTLLDEWRALEAAATPGLWEWRNSSGDPMLTSRSNRHLVMGFRRMGMHRAQPVLRDRKNPALIEEAGRENLYTFPDAAFIAASRTIVPRLLAAVEAVLGGHPATRLGCITHLGRTDCGCTPLFACVVCAQLYPCPTVTDLHAALIGDDDE